MENPFISDAFEIRWSRLTPDRVEDGIRAAIAEARGKIAAIPEAAAARPGYAASFGALEEAFEGLNRAWSKVGHLDAVCNSEALRAAHNAMLPEVTEFYSSVPLDAGLWRALQASADTDECRGLDAARRRHIDETLADFREQGADLADDRKARVSGIRRELADLTQKYSEHVLDATNAWELVVREPQRLAGLPASAVDAARQSALEKGHGSDAAPAWRFTLQVPSLIAVLSYADDEALRREVWQAYDRLGSDAPHDNRPLVPRILELRRELAGLIGKPHFPDLVLGRRMAGSGAAALEFVQRIHRRVADAAARENRELQAFRARQTGGEPALLEPWESAYWAEKQRRAEFDFDEEELRPYLPIDRVIAGLFEISQRLFRLRFEERRAVFIEPGSGGEPGPGEVEVWHPEVRFYDTFDALTGAHIGSFYADWHPRESKRGGAWMNTLLTGGTGTGGDGRQPHLGLICGNLTPAVGGKPALLTHREVETVFHEFGHLLHHLCGEVEVKSLNGVQVPWDFVELPSQIMENWCWDRGSLDLFARHHETGEAIPDDLYERMVAARNFRSGSANLRQLALGKLDLELHLNWTGGDLDAFVDRALEGYQPAYKTRPRPYTYHFGHLFGDPVGYAAGYYSYKWSEVLDADAFTRFQKEGILNPQTGLEFREKILARGNAEDPAQLFRDFMGRDPDPEAMLRRDGLVA